MYLYSLLINLDIQDRILYNDATNLILYPLLFDYLDYILMTDLLQDLLSYNRLHMLFPVH
nr:MAG TPA: hypothetical protein [Bacteriophage sp.]